MGKIYKRVGGRVPKLCHIGGGGGRGIRIKRRPSASLSRGGNGGGRCAGGKGGRYNGTGCLGYYIKSNLIIIDLRIGGRSRGGLLLLTTNSRPAILKTTRKYFLILISVPVRKLVRRNFIIKKKAKL